MTTVILFCVLYACVGLLLSLYNVSIYCKEIDRETRLKNGLKKEEL